MLRWGFGGELVGMRGSFAEINEVEVLRKRGESRLCDLNGTLVLLQCW